MLGQGVGYLSASFFSLPGCLAGSVVLILVVGGGMIGDAWGIRRPFEVAFCSFLLSTLYVRIAMPFIPAESLTGGSGPKSKGLAGFLSPLRVLAPQTVLLQHGGTRRHYGVLFLCGGVFLGVVSLPPPPSTRECFLTRCSWLRVMRRC
jgi:hypothetical protein